MAAAKVKILDTWDIQARLMRMAYEIYEAYFLETELVVIGIDTRGGMLARHLADNLQKISPLHIVRVDCRLDPEPDGTLGIDIGADVELLRGKNLIVVDDVMYTGRTLMNVLAILLHTGPRSIRTAILIDRGHRLMPVHPDVVGIELATTLQQHVSVEIDPDGEGIQAFVL
ncbi:MAG: phosphoribosyltransferase family protein [Bacteroidia bacterium]|nr:phosphoribosyltransferase family protein [Bacteroidia bacterium]